MEDELDKDIKKRIREVFDQYEDPRADEGWSKLREKFPVEKTKRRAMVWWWAAAALLLLFLGFGVWEYERNDNPAPLTINKDHRKNTHGNKEIEKNSPEINNPAPDNIVKDQDKTAGGNIHKNNLLTMAPSKARRPANDRSINKLNTDTKNHVDYITNKPGRVTIHTDSTKNKPVNKQTNLLAANSGADTTKVLNTPVNTTAAVNKPANKPLDQKKSIASMFADDKQPAKKEERLSDAKVRFGIYAATYFNYAKGSGNQANLGAGVTADIRLSKNLKLETGITLAQNSFNFGNSVPTYAAQSSISIAAPAVARVSAYRAAALVTLASVPAFKDYDASLVGLDIPLNLKYEFNPQKNAIYVLAGFSSGTFINETYTYQYNYPAILSPSLQQVKDETTRNSFNSFYFAKTLNFAFGIGYPVGKNRIIFEPFLKYPLEGLGSQDIKFGAGGINLKFNFSTGKK